MKARILVLATLLSLTVMSVSAQDKIKRWGLELNGGISCPANEPENTDLKPGIGFEGLVHYRIYDYLGVFAGWGRNDFSSTESFLGDDITFEETGYIMGVQYNYNAETLRISPFIRLGALYSHLELENDKGDIIKDSGHGWGFQVAAGIDIPLGKNWSLTPGFKYSSLSRDIKTEGAKMPVDNQYFTARIGILKRF